MSKQSKRSKEQRQEERERQQRWGKQQKALHEKQLLRDMQPLTANGGFATEALQERVVAQALSDSQGWRHEPEFADLVFDPYVNRHALEQAWHEMEFDPEAFERLSEDEQDEQTLELHVLALGRVLTPQFKKDFLRCLERFRGRLRQKRQWEPLAQASLVQLLLESELQPDESAWPECLLIFQLHTEAVDRYVELQNAAETAMTQALQTLGKTAEDELNEAESAQLEELLQEAARSTPGLLDYLERTTDEVFDDALHAVRGGLFFFNLFSPEETQAFMHRFVAALVAANPQRADPEDLSPEEVAEVDEAITNAVAVYLDDLDTPQRRAEFYQLARVRLAETAAQAEDPLKSQAELLQHFLEDETLPLADNELFQAALMGEADFYFKLTKRSRGDDSPDRDAVEPPGDLA